MLFGPGLLGETSVALISLSLATIAAILVQVVSADDSSAWIMRRPVQFAIVLIHLPLVLVIVNGVTGSIRTSKGAAQTIAALCILLALAFHVIAVWWVELRILHRRLGIRQLSAGAVLGEIVVNSSVKSYKEAVVRSETGMRRMDNIQWRIAPYFKTPEIVNFIAMQRFGEGSPNLQAYAEEHERRRKLFMQFLASGGQVREIYSLSRLLTYVAAGTHAANLWPLDRDMIRSILAAWIQCLRTYPNYYVAITEIPVPIKYHIINQNRVIIHEPVGDGESSRLNSIFLFGEDVAAPFVTDFEAVWAQVPPQWRNRDSVIRWIEEVLTDKAGIGLDALNAPNGS